MTPERFEEIRAFFEVVLRGNADQRTSALSDAREKDPELAREVEALIAAYQRNVHFFETPLARLHAGRTETGPALLKGTWIGAYELDDMIGEGGMGQVWRAEQRTPIQRTVALKLIKAGMDTHEVIRRFESERQALALMEHPSIAKVFEAGTTPLGRPYFAMEYVAGVPITTYCDQHRLANRERLQLFIRVCEGIQHAHQKAIIHRDIKPSNVLVTEVDGKPFPKIIDFGVARAISMESSEQTALTRLGTILGTPDYMSPEQALSNGASVDTRSDVYSLGVMLYELVSGLLPYNLHGLPFTEVLRKISEDSASRPSARFRVGGMDGAAAYNRQALPEALHQELQGDLDAIVIKALEKNPANRYGSPAELAADIGRYLHNEPVHARPASTLYFARKYVRRHRAVVAGASAAGFLLLAFGIWQSIQLHRITREKDRADRITQFVINMFQVSDPSESRGNQVTAREILDRASADIEKKLSKDPAMRAQLMSVMGKVYFRLGLYRRAESLLSHSVDLEKKSSGPDSPEGAQSMSDLANALSAIGKRAEAKKLDEAALELRRRVLGRDDPATVKSMNNLAVDLVDEGKYKDAEQLQRSVVSASRRVMGDENPSTLMAMENLGSTLEQEGKYREAEELQRTALRIKRKTLGSDHPETLRAMQSVAETLYDKGEYQEAEQLDREALTHRIKVLGPEHRETLNTMVALANPLAAQDRLGEAEGLLRRAIELQTKTLGPEHPDALLASNNLADVLADELRYEEAEKLARQVTEIRARVLGPENANTLLSKGRLASILARERSLAEAEPLALSVRDAQNRTLGADDPEKATTTYTLACIAAQAGKTAEALTLLRGAIDHGLRPNIVRGLAKDPALEPIRADPGFGQLLAYNPQPDQVH
jgi:non-specific serine/threonine protein kinase/serine/threonine-protein kinase